MGMHEPTEIQEAILYAIVEELGPIVKDVTSKKIVLNRKWKNQKSYNPTITVDDEGNIYLTPAYSPFGVYYTPPQKEHPDYITSIANPDCVSFVKKAVEDRTVGI